MYNWIISGDVSKKKLPVVFVMKMGPEAWKLGARRQEEKLLGGFDLAEKKALDAEKKRASLWGGKATHYKGGKGPLGNRRTRTDDEFLMWAAYYKSTTTRGAKMWDRRWEMKCICMQEKERERSRNVDFQHPSQLMNHRTEGPYIRSLGCSFLNSGLAIIC